MLGAEDDTGCWHAPSVHVKNTKFTTHTLNYFTISERRMDFTERK